MLIQAGVAAGPEVQKQRPRPGENQIPIMHSYGLIDVASAPFRICFTPTLSKLFNFQHW